MAPSVRHSKPSYEMTTKRTCLKCRIYNTKKPYLIRSWILNGKYAPNENITLTAEVTKLLPWVFDTGDPVPWEAWQTLVSLLAGLPAYWEIKVDVGWRPGSGATEHMKPLLTWTMAFHFDCHFHLQKPHPREGSLHPELHLLQANGQAPSWMAKGISYRCKYVKLGQWMS